MESLNKSRYSIIYRGTLPIRLFVFCKKDSGLTSDKRPRLTNQLQYHAFQKEELFLHTNMISSGIESKAHLRH